MAHTERINFKEFRERFSDESACKNYLYQLRWPEGFTCPKCGRREFSFVKSRKIFQCKQCRHQTSLTAGTVMHKTHLPMTIWFWAIYLTARDKRGVSATQLAAELEVSYETAWYLLLRIRTAMSQRDHDYMLSGIVELDDTYFGATEQGSKRGRGTSKINIMVAISKDEKGRPQYLKMKVIDNLQGVTIGAFAEVNIAQGSTIQSDAYRSYHKPLIGKYNHQYEVFDSNTDMLHWLHVIVGNAKAFLLGTYHGNCRANLQPFLDEFCYRFNRRGFKDELFSRLLHAVTRSNIVGSAVLSR
jgi:transposase-like protein